MKHALIALAMAACLAGPGLAEPPPAFTPAPPSTRPSRELSPEQQYASDRMVALVEGWKEIAGAAGFSGEIAFGAVPRRYPILVSAAQNKDGSVRDAGQLWRWASVTKQVVATLVMQQVEAGMIDLDESVATYLPDFASPNAATITVEHLLRHQSGLPNPSAMPEGTEGLPAFYLPGSGIDPLAFCAGTPTGAPGGDWSYNNCDYIVAGALLERVTGKSWRELVAERIADPAQIYTLSSFPNNEPTVSGIFGGSPEATQDIAQYQASGALYGRPSDVIKFDLALMGGKLLGADALATLWDGKPELGYMALGQWVFEFPLAGCTDPVRIVERRGAIGGVQVRNFLLPDFGIAIALFSDRGEGDFDFGEVWQGSGFSHDMLSLAACPQEAA
ncbi:serine hydrolase domain-containing protein [Qipengyuania sp. JC766]|uniref:serine hydrolase domain-containing protein n=1 Tax=Qipengyuania sp. JC766 TaxID=3232139 RepID=UPI003459C9D5